MVLIPYFEFVRIPVQLFKALGQDIFESSRKTRLHSFIMNWLFYFGFGTYITEYILQLVFFFLTLRTGDYLQAYAEAPTVGFGNVALFKIVTLFMRKAAIRKVLEQLEDIYPKTRELQKGYKVEECFRHSKFVMKLYAGICLMNIVYFILFPIVKSVLSFLIFGMEFDFPLPLFLWYPYDPRSIWWIYILTYVMEVYGSVLVSFAYASADLFLVAAVQQLCMQFKYIANKLEEFKPTSDDENREFLRAILKNHIKCLDLTYTVDKIFSSSLFLNFVASSATLCFVSFQVTSATTEELLQYTSLMVTALSQVFIISFYGNELIEASQAIGEAAFGHPWYMCDASYRKMVVLIVGRSQKVAALHAPFFPPICLETFMKVVKMAYQFFTVIRTTSDY